MIKPMELSREERLIIKRLKKAGILEDMLKHHFEGKEDVVWVGCPDGRQMIRGILNRFMEMYDGKHDICFHPLSKHGGTLILDKGSPLLKKGHTTDIDLIGDIQDAVDMGYKAICLVNHMPCGMARKKKVSPLKIVESLIGAKKRIKDAVEGETSVACFIQVTDGEERNIYHISCKKFLEWRKKNK